MTQVTGEIERIEAREVPGHGTFYDVIVNGKKYGNGKYAPRGFQQGDIVSFEYETKQRGQYINYNIKARTMRKAEGAQPAQGNQAEPRKELTPVPAKSQYVAFDERQEIISKQAALNTAIQLGNLALEAGAVLVNKSAKDNEKLTLVHNWILSTAAEIYGHTTGREWDVQLADNVDTPKEQAKATAARGRKAAASKSEDTGADEYGDDFADDDIPF